MDKIGTPDNMKLVETIILNGIIGLCNTYKERGFYEPKVRFDDGGEDYIMISDKNNRFKSYYQIGNHVFGNLNEESVIRELNDVNKRCANLESQLATILVLRQARRKVNEI